MELDSNQTFPVLADPSPVDKPRLGVPSAFSFRKFIMSPMRKPSNLDDVRSNGWLDAMKSSSPPRKKLIKDFNVEEVTTEDDFVHRTWLLKYPSAINSFGHIAAQAKNKKIAVFLDYDGTLSPIVDDPDRAIMSDSMRAAVKDVAKYFPTAIISGRSRDKVYKLVGLTELYYAGSHGMDILTPVNGNCIGSTDEKVKEENLFQPAREFIQVIDEIFLALVEKTESVKGAKVENHKFCVSVHYRNVNEKPPVIEKPPSTEKPPATRFAAQLVHDLLKRYPNLRLTHGRKVLEVRPVIDWNKGRAVEFLLESLGLSRNDDVIPIYIGDDRTDEDAFKVLREGKRGFGILVSAVPKESNAFYSLRDTSEVKKFLKTLVKWAKVEKSTGFL